MSASDMRFIIVWLLCACAAGSGAARVADDECALYLSGPARSSAYDYTINLLKGNFGYEGQHTCITYEAVNQAYLEARQRIVVAQPKGDWKPEDFASVGELVLDISTNLARRYSLTYEEIEKGLPLIDTSRTLIREVCPPVFSHVECRAGKYRRLDGLCNNLQHPTWGAINAPFQRLLSPLFADGMNAPRIAHSGHDLPLSRVVSRTMHPDDGFHDHAGTVMVIAWGQFMDHDYTLTGTPLDPINRNDPEECCKRPPHLKHPYCNEIRIPDDDYFYRLFGVKCIDFVRGFPSPRPGCRLGSRVPFNTLTGAIDGNTVYGVTEKFARKLRTGYGGLLRMNPVFKEYGLKDLLPLKLDIPDEGCTRPNKNMFCFEAGEIRVNEQLVLTVMHTLMAREHNRAAEALAAVNPHWDDETLYQEARRINIAEIQHITYNEFLPILLGKDVMEKFGLVLEKQGYWDGYDSEVNPDVLASFAAAAYRFGHSLLPTAVERWSKAHKFIASKRLSDLIRRPYDLYRAGVLDEYVMGLMNQVAQAMDDSITQEVTNHLFKKVGARFGMDLVSFNMQRGREFGLPGYMEFRKFCGLPGAETFQELFGSMTNQTVRKYESIFERPDDVDLWSGGVSERPLPGSMLGPTFACIIATQFSYSRRGDRFWFELPNQPSSFTEEQLAELRKARLARVICDNTDIIDTVQLYPMVLPDHELNPRVPCRSGIIPSIDFSKWAEPAPFPASASAKDFVTAAFFELINNSSVEINDTVSSSPAPAPALAPPSPASPDAPNLTNDTSLQYNTTAPDVALDPIDKTKHNKTNGKHSFDRANKSKGHYKNSLRKKRSVNANEPRPLTAPLIVNYETSHDGETDKETWLPAKNTANVIKLSDLADFNIETLHNINKDPESPQKTEDHPDSAEEPKNYVKEDKPSQEIDESEEKYSTTERNIPSTEHDSNESGEKSDKYKNEEERREQQSEEETDDRESKERSAERGGGSGERDDTRELGDTGEQGGIGERGGSGERDDTRELGDTGERGGSGKQGGFREQGGSGELDDIRELGDTGERGGIGERGGSGERSGFREQGGSGERGDTRERDDIKELGNLGERGDTRERGDASERGGPAERGGSAERDDTGERGGSAEGTSSRYSDDDRGTYSRDSGPPPQRNNIQDVDLGDFSYENVALNNNGEVVTASELGDNVPKKSADIQHGRDKSDEVNESSSDESKENNEPTHINDGEVKPVVEINAENGDSSEEHSDESSSDHEDQNTEIVPDKGDNIHNKNKLSEGIRLEEGDVKQQFERIPLDYKHRQESSQENQDPQSDNKKSLAPKNIKYDENLNIKFDDISIKLPDIKLPDDVLSYAYEDTPVFRYDDSNPKERQRFYHYGSEEEGERADDAGAERKEEDEDDEQTRPGEEPRDGRPGAGPRARLRGPPRSQHEDDEEEDLYEKFVKERFGKRGSFGKRAEALLDYRSTNPQLYRTVENIIQKTEQVKKQADKSGDPNAGYMWTLEYGQKL